MSFIHQKITWNPQCARPVPVVPVRQHTLSWPSLVFFILCQLLLGFSLNKACMSGIAVAHRSQAAAFTFALELPGQRLPAISQFSSLLGIFLFYSAENLIWLVKDLHIGRALALLSAYPWRPYYLTCALLSPGVECLSRSFAQAVSPTTLPFSFLC